MIEIQHLTKTFSTQDGTLDALKDVSITVEDGDIFGIIGMSGAGKSTLVRCINMLERPTEGKVLIDGCDLGALSEKELRAKRREITMIFQGFNLLMQRNCLKNVCFPLELAGVPKEKARKRALELLEIVDLKEKAASYPAQLSGGQQQRVAIARALATDPRVLLCDEATSALDPQTTHAILNLIREINRKLGITVIIITHQMSVVEEICSHVAILDEGAVVEQGAVSDVFSSPQSAAAKRLVIPEGELALSESGSARRKIRAVFNGSDTANQPVIARMAAEEKLLVNILNANTKTVGEKAYGTMILSVNGGDAEFERALAYLNAQDNLTAEEV